MTMISGNAMVLEVRHAGQSNIVHGYRSCIGHQDTVNTSIIIWMEVFCLSTLSYQFKTATPGPGT